MFKRETTDGGSGGFVDPLGCVSINPCGIESSSFAQLPVISIVVPDDRSIAELEGNVTYAVIDITIGLGKGKKI